MTSSPGVGFARAAHGYVGMPFRLRGRDPASGVDCIGLVCCSLAAVDRFVPPVPRYTLRNLSICKFVPLLHEAGFQPTSGSLAAGDLLLLRPSPGQFHLAINGSNDRMIHAHAGLGRVVSTPTPALASITARWRLS